MNKRLTAEGLGKGLVGGGCIIELVGGMKRRRGGVPNEDMGVVQCWPARLFVFVCSCVCIYASVSVSYCECVLSVRVMANVGVCMCK